MHPLTLYHTQITHNILIHSPLKPFSTLQFTGQNTSRHYTCLCCAPPSNTGQSFLVLWQNVSMLSSLTDKTHNKWYWHANQTLHTCIPETSFTKCNSMSSNNVTGYRAAQIKRTSSGCSLCVFVCVCVSAQLGHSAYLGIADQEMPNAFFTL
jgi:hypothetical protein